MSNIERFYCSCCGTVTQHYNVEIGIWECDDCGTINEDESDLDSFDDEDTEEYMDEDDSIEGLENSEPLGDEGFWLDEDSEDY